MVSLFTNSHQAKRHRVAFALSFRSHHTIIGMEFDFKRHSCLSTFIRRAHHGRDFRVPILRLQTKPRRI